MRREKPKRKADSLNPSNFGLFLVGITPFKESTHIDSVTVK